MGPRCDEGPDLCLPPGPDAPPAMLSWAAICLVLFGMQAALSCRDVSQTAEAPGKLRCDPAGGLCTLCVEGRARCRTRTGMGLAFRGTV